MNWVTWENVGVDRMACAWLIRKHVDSDARFLFVPYGSHRLPEGAEPFDIPGVRLSHHQGHCSFHAFLKEYDIADPVMHRIARIIDEADTVQEVQIEPVAPGLDLICEGLRLTSPNDTVAFERGTLVYDALYAKLAAERAPP
ncbi:MAG: chromate resistance protein [Planctomycetes bacterium]|nr:chromate resistance protein [Planctomycetota bacterium]